jgi:peroxiredoxin
MLAVVGGLVGLAGCGPQGHTSDPSRAGTGPRAPDFSIDLLTGETFRLSEHLGKDVIVLDFWTTYCQPCIGALQHLSEFYVAKKSRGLVVLAVAMDQPETTGNIVPFVRSHNLAMLVAHDAQSRVTDLYNKKSLAPYQVLIARDGRIIKQRESYQPGDESGMEADINIALDIK